ncbi:HD-GYP domain-containing protein [Gaopeijia maritima]|uniref:HD-GYP domain-containing protein n=1 Tax=Gaopeijia maritima TaxID=3119007 RepID=UPI003248EE41
MTFIPLLACVLLFGSAGPVLFVGLTGAVGEIFFRKKEALRSAFNVAQYVLASAVAGIVFDASGGVPSAAGGLGDGGVGLSLGPFVAFTLVMLSLNHSLVAGAIALSQGVSYRSVWHKTVGKSGVNVFYDFLLSPIAFVLAYLVVELGIRGLFLAIFPLLAVRRAYQTSWRLQQANRDLLTALVKAIETRDPYTSGHSRRVQMLASRIVRQMALSEKRIEAIEQAALLHDVGKIDAVYTEILKKPSQLSPEEREVIESHVTKGVELLTSLSSFPKEVIEAVRHHHEREDGKGYPDGLHSQQIPLGAKVIMICDAIDAMLSDRPYRKALPLEAVREQLDIFSGKQFDPDLVRLVVSSTILEDHQQEVAREVAAGSDEPYPAEAPASSERPTPLHLSPAPQGG